MSISDVLGELQWNSKLMTNQNLPRSSTMNGHNPSETTDGLQENLSSEETLPMYVSQRQKQWTTDTAGVPHFLCILSKKNYLLFACG